MTEVLETQSPPAESTGSSETETGGFQCPYCSFVGKTERGLSVHVSHKHKGASEPAFEDKPKRVAPPPLVDGATKKPSTLPTDFKALEEETATNIEAVGQLLHGVLFMAKVARLQNPDSRFPQVNTHLAFALQMRAAMTAKVLTEYAAKNQALAKILMGFNAMFKGGELGAVVGSLAVAGLATAGRPAPGPLQAMLIPDVMQAVDAEDRQIVAQLRAAHAAQNGHQG